MLTLLILLLNNIYRSNYTGFGNFLKMPKDINAGIDARYPVNETYSNIDAIIVLHENLERMRLLKLLQKDNVSNITKLHKIDKFIKTNTNTSDYRSNLYSGDLLGDWNFEGF